jgi:CO/xanthine dehydrogenase FAD-binding subunit
MKTIEDIECAFPGTLKEALELMADERTRGRPLAGGTDLMVQWSSSVLPIADRAVSLLAVPELRGIREAGESVDIGAAVTHAELRGSPLVLQYLPALAAAAATIGGAQIQARGTIAGNVANASPAGDLAPSLLITDGSVVVASLAGERQVPLDEFFLAYRKIDLRPDELIVRLVLPKCPAGGCELFRKLGPRAAQAISKVMGSCRAVVEKGAVRSLAVALGSVAPVPMRLYEVEKMAEGRRLDAALVSEAERLAASLVKPIDDIRSTAEYRAWAAGRLVRGFLETLLP